MPYFLLHTNSLMALSLFPIMANMWLFLRNSATNTPTRTWLMAFYGFQALWQFSEIFHYAFHPAQIGSLPYSLLMCGWTFPALACVEIAYIQFNYLFLHDTFPRERRLLLWLSGGLGGLLCGFIGWNEFYNQSNLDALNFAGFLYGSLTNLWILIVCCRKWLANRRNAPHVRQGIAWMASVNLIFVTMCLIVISVGFYSAVGYWTYCTLLWVGNLAEIVVYLNFSAVPTSLKDKQVGFTQITVASILLTVMLVFCPPIDILDVTARLAQQDSLFKIMLLIIGSVSLITLLLPRLIDATLTQPVLRLVEGIQRIDAGDLSVQVALTTQDEVGVLTQHVNQMTRSLHEARAELTHYAQTLEEQVAIRTAELRADKARIEEQAQQLETVMRELHHRVKNNLAIVSGLLSLQLNRLEDQQAVKAFQEGQRRIEAISLIHQRLYQSEELTRSTMQAYGYQPSSVRLNIRSDVAILDVDMAVPLSLIINEILTNAFKYAIPNAPTPTLSISLLNRNGLLLEVVDNGPGINLAHWHSPTSSFGKRLIKGLSEQLGGSLVVENLTSVRTQPIPSGQHTLSESPPVTGQTGAYFQLYVPEKKSVESTAHPSLH
jgi:two-component sensor histidine kinase/HAMP domain-containing protein